MKVILGLGNPGLKFKFSRHNLGFLVVEKLAKSQKIEINQRGFSCLFGQGKLEANDLFLAKPLTFMNLSGQAASSIVKKKKIDLADLLVVVDDVNLPVGRIRIRPGGSDGGHRGLRSIIEALGTQEFPRLRIGAGAQPGKARLSAHVLSRFNKSQTKIINEALEKACECSIIWTKEGIQAAMNRFN